MPELNILAILVAAVAVFVVSTVYYIAFAARVTDLRGGEPAAEDGGMAPWKIVVELVRCVVVAGVVAGLAALLDIGAAGDALLLAGALWVGFPVVLLLGSVIWENVRPGLAALHSGDWLLKLVVIALIVSLWP